MPQLLMLPDDVRVDSAELLLSERVAVEQLGDRHYAIQLAERLRWAAEDAEERAAAERRLK